MKEALKQHEFKAEWVEDNHGQALMLTQSDGYCDPQTVLLHPQQFRTACDHFGLLPAADEVARRTVALLSRRVQKLADRIDELNSYMRRCSDHEHADLSTEMAMLAALNDLAGEWAQEVQDLRGVALTGEAAQ